jgi:hypothetical protein
MWRSVGSSMIKNTPTLNGRAVFLGRVIMGVGFGANPAVRLRSGSTMSRRGGFVEVAVRPHAAISGSRPGLRGRRGLWSGRRFG